MLSLKYYSIVHKVETKDYTQSLQTYQEINKDDFRHHMYAITMKPTAEPSNLHEFCPSSIGISKFDDEEEIIPKRKRRQPRRRDDNTNMSEADFNESTKELKTVDISSQLFLSSKQTQGEQLQVTGGLYLGRGVFTRPEQNCECNAGSWYDSEDNKGISKGNAAMEES